MSVFDKAKEEIKEMLDLLRYIERFDNEIMYSKGIEPTETSTNKRNKAERRYVYLAKKYTT